MKTAKPALAGVLAIFALLAVFCVVDQDENAHEFVAKDASLSGSQLLASQAAQLRRAKALRDKGKNMASFDEMLHKFTAPKEDEELTAALKAQAPVREYDVGLVPDKYGNIKMPQKKPEIKKKSAFSFDDLNLLQDPVSDWIPGGQEELDEQIAIAKAKEEQDAEKEFDDDVLSNAHKKDDWDLASARDMVFMQMSASTDDEDEQDQDNEWVPKGQSGLAAQLKQAHDNDAKKHRIQDGLKGNTVMSVAGFDDQTEKSNEFDFGDLSLVQTGASNWVPSGQAGLSSQIAAAQVADDNAEMEADGLTQDDLLGGLASESILLQMPKRKVKRKDHVRSWKPQGQKIQPSHSYEQHKQTTKVKKKNPWGVPAYDGLDGDTILSAVSLGHHQKERDEADSMGGGFADDFDANDLLDN